MSRHRNIRNISANDYYDDDDYYDDYYEEDDDEYYLEQERQRKAREAEQKRAQAKAVQKQQQQQQQRTKQVQQQQPKKATMATTTVAAAGKGQVQSQTGATTAEQKEKELLVSQMGFSSSDARLALIQSNWDVQRAIDSLLSSPTPSSLSSSKVISKGTTKPVKKHNAPLVFDASPPPGFTKPKQDTVASAKKTPPFNASPPPGYNKPTTASPKKEKRNGGGGLSVISNAKQSPRDRSKTPPPPKREIPSGIKKMIENQRSKLSMVVLGHVDAGKSTLMGQVLVQLGHVEKRTVTKYQKQAAELGKASFALAWVMDEDDSERERGVTMEIGTKYAVTEKHDLTILDAPGHADFIPAMITGAASADVGLLVVAATTGEFEAGFEINEDLPSSQQQNMGQTREHIILSRGLGVSQLIVVVNKLDAADPPWSQQRFEHIKSRLLPFLHSNGFQQKRIRFIPISGLTGVNVKEKPGKQAEELAKWYNGPTLLKAIDDFLPAQRNVEKPLRMIVSDVYSEGRGVIAKARVTQGLLQVGDKVAVLPIGDEAVVGRIEHGKATSASASPYSYAPSSTTTSSSSPGDNADRSQIAIAGDSIDIVLTGIDIARTSPGCILSHTESHLRPPVKKKILAKILSMESLLVPIIRGSQVLLHMHSIDVPAAITKLVCTTKRNTTKTQERPRMITGGSNATVEVTMKERICMEEFSACRSLGRFVLRRGGDTIAVGVIEQILG